MADSQTEQVLNELAQLVESGGLGGSDFTAVKGGSHLFVVNASTRLAHHASGNRRLRGVSIDGTNVVVSTSGTSFTTVNNATSYSDASIICIRGNSSNDKTGWFGPMNIELPFGDQPNLNVYVDNGGAAPCRVTFYWDYVN